MVSRTLMVASVRDLRRHLVQTLLSLLGIALGVAVMVAVDLANESARRAFALSMDSLTGNATHRVVREGVGIPDSWYVELRRAHDVRPSTAIVEGVVTLGGQTYRLLGIDPFTDGAFRASSGNLAEGDMRRLLTEPGTALMAANDRSRLQIELGSTVTIAAAGRTRELTIVGELSATNSAAVEGLLVADIATAQELLNRIGVIDRIELILDRSTADRLRTLLPDGARLEAASTDHSTQLHMTEAFHTNLTAMGLLALLVGALLVYNTVSFSVLRRRQQLGLLRVIGATRKDLLALVMAESLALGLLGSAAGIGLGVLIGQGLIQMVTRTINDLYFVLTVSTLLISKAVLVKGLLIGLGTALLAATVPAIDAARTSPEAAVRRSGVERQIHGLAPWAALLGSLVIVLGLGLIALPADGLLLAFTALFLTIIGYAMLIPWCLLWLSRWLQPVLTRLFGKMGRLSARNVAAGLSRTGIAVAALTVAVSATVGVGTMVQSFRATVQTWLEQTLSSDIYISAADIGGSRSSSALPSDLPKRLTTLPGVTSVSTGRPFEARTAFGPIPALALGDAAQVARGFRFKATAADDVWPLLRKQHGIFVSESLAYQYELSPGDRLEIDTPDGPQTLAVAAVFYDYSSDRGLIVIDRGHYARRWRDPDVTTAGVRLADDADLDQVQSLVRGLIATYSEPLAVRSNADIRRQSLQIFDRTFAITNVLRLLAIGVAFVGVLSALLALQLDRAREHATLRAVGVTPRQLGGLMSLECGLMGLTAGMLSLPLGWMTAQLLMHVINKRSFGWSMQSALSADMFLEALALATFAAVLAGAYPAWRLSRLTPATALRDE